MQYVNNLNWIYIPTDEVVCVFHNNKLLKTIDKQEFYGLLEVGYIKVRSK
jgi:hypothetical protein